LFFLILDWSGVTRARSSLPWMEDFGDGQVWDRTLVTE
jgi:hypothetical protein